MPKPITVAVAGATGTQGGGVARALLDRGHRVRALTRRPDSAAATALTSLGVEIHRADLTDRDAVRRAIRGADTFFLMATPYEAGVEAEVREGNNGAGAAKDAGVKHLVYSSVASADRNTRIPHFDSKYEVEQHIRGLGVPFTIVGPVFFMENLLNPAFVPSLRTGTLALPLPARRPLQMIAAADIARFFCLVIERPAEFQGKRIDIASDARTGTETAQVISQASGREIPYAEVPLDALRAQSADLGRMWEWFDETGYSVDIDALVRAYPEVGWHDLRSWAREQDWRALDAARPEHPSA